MFNKTKGIKNSSMSIFVTAHSGTGIKRSLTSLLICKARWFRNASTAMRIFGTISRHTISRKRCEGKKRLALRAIWANFRCLLSEKTVSSEISWIEEMNFIYTAPITRLRNRDQLSQHEYRSERLLAIEIFSLFVGALSATWSIYSQNENTIRGKSILEVNTKCRE